SSWVALAISYSGNTEETLAAYNHAIKRGCPHFIIASGGELLSRGNSLGKVKVLRGYRPRAAFPLIFPAVLNLVECLLGLKPTDLTDIANSLSRKMMEWENSSLSPKEFAQELSENIPIFIGSRHLVPVAYRAKCQMNENAKVMAFYSEIPEANHNEIESFINGNEFKILPVFLRSAYEDERIKKRMNITTSLYGEEGYSSVRLSTSSSSVLEEMLALTLYLDLVSVELARIRKVDAASNDRISRLKNDLI
ncbi:MAG: SIS domain-containing protein, partial [Candidatus Thorarchaeota archaeon]